METSSTLTHSHPFRQMIEHSPLGILLESKGDILYSNKKLAQILGYDSASLLMGKSLTAYIHPSYVQYYSEWLNQVLAGRPAKHSIELILLTSTNQPINVEMNASLVEQQVLQIIVNEITERKRNEKDLQCWSENLSLQHEINHNLLINHLKQALKYTSPHATHVAIMLIDLDHLKLINETYGFMVGDILLQAVLQRLKKVASAQEAVLTFGSNKFVVLMKDIKKLDQVQQSVQKFINVFAQSFLINAHELFTTITSGISVYPEDGLEPTSLLKSAELAQYYAKQQGQNNYRFYTSSMAHRSREKNDLLYELRHALINNELLLFYQPIVDIRTGEVKCLEALLRWLRDGTELLTPAHFLGVAEEAGLIVAIGEWVIRMACMQSNKWSEAGISLPISINLSSRQFSDRANLVVSLQNILSETQLSPVCLQLEMSENVTVLDIGADMLTAFKKMGVKLTIDDFGASYISLNELKRYQIDNIKIDQTLIRVLPEDPDNCAIVTAIIAMGSELHIDVMAEGVETKDQLDFLREHGCYYLQGNYICPPLVVTEIQAILQGQQPLPMLLDNRVC